MKRYSMKRTLSFKGLVLPTLVIFLALAPSASATEEAIYNGVYTGERLNRIAFPIGGIGAGMFCLEGTGAISHMSIRNTMEYFHEPAVFAALCVKGEEKNTARVLEGPIPDWKYFGRGNFANGAPGSTYGLPRFREASFKARFPFATVSLTDEKIPFEVEITGWSPFVPGDPDASSLPVGALEYRFVNRDSQAHEAVFSFSARNFLAQDTISSRIISIPGGFVLQQRPFANKAQEANFAVFLEEENVAVDHCWFRGGWWDALTLAWRNVQEATLLNNPPEKNNAPGATLSFPFSLKAGEERCIRLMTAWYAPHSSLRYGKAIMQGNAFGKAPSKGTASNQQVVTGFLGKGLVNGFDPKGDGPQGALTSPEFRVRKKYIHLLVGGSNAAENACVNLLVDGKTVKTAIGENMEALTWKSWEVSEFLRQKARIQIVDQDSADWGHINVDHIIMSNHPIQDLLKDPDSGTNELTPSRSRIRVIEDFEGRDYGDWEIGETESQSACCANKEACTNTPPEEFYAPWYGSQFSSIEKVVDHWRNAYQELREKSACFRDAFYDSTLPPEVLEAVAANLTILKSPTLLRQTDGRLWCFEGCCDTTGCCHGSCTHVWNYAQALPHLFPSLERSLRQTEFNEAQFEDGCQAFRANLPISPGGPRKAASDGQLGGIMKAYRDWRICGDENWLREYWPKIQQSLEYCIATFDPRESGLLEESHHNTYDIDYFGPDGHCGTFYLGALAAAIEMGRALESDVAHYESLLNKGRARLEAELYDGEYFIQQIQKEGLTENFSPLNPDQQSEGYRALVELLNQQGPKYQYGTGCLSDGVLGLWMAKVCGLDASLTDPAKERSHLLAVHKYNLRDDLTEHVNPQRPTFAMGDDGGLLLCSWPKGGALAIPFVYSDEVWTGIEYQVASHLMLCGEVEKGLEIVRICRDRYDGVRRNPFDEYECGHWYARAMASYGLIQGLTSLRYDAVDQTLHIDSKIGDFRAFLSTATGFGVAGLQTGKPFLEVRQGAIEVEQVLVSGARTTL